MEQELGQVVHYFGHVDVAVIKLTAGDLKIGDALKFVHGEHEFTQKVDSIQIEHQSITEAKNGQEVAVKVSEKAPQGTRVYKITE